MENEVVLYNILLILLEGKKIMHDMNCGEFKLILPFWILTCYENDYYKHLWDYLETTYLLDLCTKQ